MATNVNNIAASTSATPALSTTDAMSAFEDLVTAVKIDGVVTKEEEDFLWERAQKIGISELEFKRMIQI